MNYSRSCLVEHQGKTYLIQQIEAQTPAIPVQFASQDSRSATPRHHAPIKIHDQADRGVTELIGVCTAIVVGIVGCGVLLRVLFPPAPYTPPPPPPRPVIINNPPARNPNCVAFCGGGS